MAGWPTDPIPLEATGPVGGAGRVLEAAVGPLAFTSITPFRVVATPSMGIDKLRAGFFLAGRVWRDVDDNAQIPSSIRAVTFNLTITQTEGAGYLAVIPADAAFAGVSTINWTARNVDLANNGTVGVGPRPVDGTPGCIAVLCDGPAAAAHFIIDVTGYYS